MSLLMKALEKAAKDRGEARNEQAAPAAAAATTAQARSELSLEPMAAEASQPAPRAEIAPSPRPAAATQRAAPAASSPAAREQAQASTILQAQSAGRPAGGAGAYVREHPVMVFGTLAGVAAIAFGIYVYLQIFHPALFRAAPKPPPPQPLVQAPAAPTPVAPALPSGPLLKESAAEAAPVAPVVPEPPRAKPQPAAAPAAAQDEGARNTISVSKGSPEPALNPQLAQAYAALQAGQADEARRLYGQVAGAEPRNVDALLGLAAISAQQGNTEEASRRYLQILELEPRHALAQSGLIAILGRADPLAAESRLRQLIAREPASAYLHFTLGNLYADQSQWAQAQQAYFQAHHLDPANPDYAYNLAVALEHVSQPKLALGFYRRAMQLAGARGRANFNIPQAQDRVAKLASQVE